MKILITGSNGYIAQKIISNLHEEHFLIKVCRQDFDLRNPSSTNKFFNKFSDEYFDCVIHTAISGGNRLKKDCYDDLCGNLKMFNNLVVNKNKFRKLINLGSGAETYGLNTYYGLSKKIISKIIEDNFNFYNLKIFAVFDEDEDERRFIKTNIKKYIRKKPMEIFENKMMDFFYMKDFLKIIKLYTESSIDLPKQIECCYKEKYHLYDICEIINSLSDHKVNIMHNQNKIAENYIGTFRDLNLLYAGLPQGIKKMYKNIILNLKT